MTNRKQNDRKAKAVKSGKAVKTHIAATSTKSDIIQKLLTRSKGATVFELVEATGWQAHSVRGFMSGTLKKKLRLEITSVAIDGCRAYRIVQTTMSA